MSRPPLQASSPGRSAPRRRSISAARTCRMAACPRRRRQFRQCQCLHRHEGPRGDRADGASRPPHAVGCADRRSLPCFHRRHRRTARRDEICRCSRATCTADATGDFWFEAAKAIMTTDTYPKVVDPQRRNRWRQGDDQRHRQGRRHDRAGHGDHALLRRHRCRYRAGRPAGLCCLPASGRPSTP